MYVWNVGASFLPYVFGGFLCHLIVLSVEMHQEWDCQSRWKSPKLPNCLQTCISFSTNCVFCSEVNSLNSDKKLWRISCLIHATLDGIFSWNSILFENNCTSGQCFQAKSKKTAQLWGSRSDINRWRHSSKSRQNAWLTSDIMSEVVVLLLCLWKASAEQRLVSRQPAYAAHSVGRKWLRNSLKVQVNVFWS